MMLPVFFGDFFFVQSLRNSTATRFKSTYAIPQQKDLKKTLWES